MLAGVGGQGVILASDILGEAALVAGYDVKKSDVLGMAQRGGEVISHLRLGEKVYSPLIRKGGAEFLLGFEKLEAARRAEFLKQEGVAIVNNQSLPPASVSSGSARYPSDEDIEAILRARTSQVYFIDGLAVAERLRNRNVLNLFLLGFVSHFLPVGEADWRSCIVQRVPEGFLELNLEAFALGREEAAEQRRYTRPSLLNTTL